MKIPLRTGNGLQGDFLVSIKVVDKRSYANFVKGIRNIKKIMNRSYEFESESMYDLESGRTRFNPAIYVRSRFLLLLFKER